MGNEWPMVEAFLFCLGGGVVVLMTLATSLPLIEQGVCHTVALPFTLKKYLKAKGE
jgi:hypothetical protein